MNWNKLEDIASLEHILQQKEGKKVVIFKHSTRCSISSTALARLERNFKPEWQNRADFYYLDLIQHRDISNKIASDLNVRHESPQVLVVDNGKVVYTESHLSIQPEQIEKSI